MGTNRYRVDPQAMPSGFTYHSALTTLMETNAINMTARQQVAIYVAIQLYLEKRNKSND